MTPRIELWRAFTDRTRDSGEWGAIPGWWEIHVCAGLQWNIESDFLELRGIRSAHSLLLAGYIKLRTVWAGINKWDTSSFQNRHKSKSRGQSQGKFYRRKRVTRKGWSQDRKMCSRLSQSWEGDKTEWGACSVQCGRGRGKRKGPGRVREEVLIVNRNIRLERMRQKFKYQGEPGSWGFVCVWWLPQYVNPSKWRLWLPSHPSRISF